MRGVSLSTILAFATPRGNFRSRATITKFGMRPRDIMKMSTSSAMPKIAVVGSGAVGCYYGSRLWEAGYDVSFHMRGKNYQTCKSVGLKVSSILGDVFIPPDSLRAFETTKEMDKADWVVVAMKSGSLAEIPKLVLPLLHNETRVLVIMNGLVEEDLLSFFRQHEGKDDNDRSLTSCAAIYGAMAFICSSRVEHGNIQHTHAGWMNSGVAASSVSTTDEANQKALEALWTPTKVDCDFEPSLLRGRWKKNVWNLPFNGISVAMGGISVDVIVKDPGLRSLAYCVMDETVAIANADLASNGYDSSWFLGEKEKEQMMHGSDIMGFYLPSTTIDLQRKRPMEVRYLFRKPLERAQQLRIEAPHLETLVLQIEALQRMHGLE